jgi:tRNA-splicing ligase RtcB
MAREQLGTVGSGNHYVDIFEDEAGRIWVGVHFGSRGLGYETATHFLKAAGATDGMDVDPCVIDAAGDLGADYLACMELAGRYALRGAGPRLRSRDEDPGGEDHPGGSQSP